MRAVSAIAELLFMFYRPVSLSTLCVRIWQIARLQYCSAVLGLMFSAIVIALNKQETHQQMTQANVTRKFGMTPRCKKLPQCTQFSRNVRLSHRDFFGAS